MLVLACINGQNVAVPYLLCMKNKMNAENNDGLTALHFACSERHKDVVKLLLVHSKDRNIDLNARDNTGSTAFMRACFFGQTDIVKLFLEYSEDRSIEIGPITPEY